MGKLEEALVAFKRAHKHNPKLRWVLTRLAVVYANLGRIEEARNTLEPLIKYYAGRGVEVVNFIARSPFDEQHDDFVINLSANTI